MNLLPKKSYKDPAAIVVVKKTCGKIIATRSAGGR